MPTENPFKFHDVHTNRGAVAMLTGHSLGPGQPDSSSLTTSGVFADRETVTIDGDVYEIVDLSTDSTVDVLTFWNNTDEVITQTAIDGAGDYQFTVGEYVAVESEIAIVTDVVINSTTDNDVTFFRGVAGTTVAAHATGTTAIEVDDGTALTAGAITVPSIAVTAAAGLDALAAVIGKGGDRGPFQDEISSNRFGVGHKLALPSLASPEWAFANLDDTTGLLYSTVSGARDAVVAETCTNAAWDETPTSGGSQPTSSPRAIVSRVPSADAVTLGTMYFKFPFRVLQGEAYVYTTATGAAVAWDGAVTVTDAANGIVAVDNSGLTDWAATDTVVLAVDGEGLAVANLPAIR